MRHIFIFYRALLTCQVCDKNFQNQDMLTQHMATHRTTSKLLHRWVISFVDFFL